MISNPYKSIQVVFFVSNKFPLSITYANDLAASLTATFHGLDVAIIKLEENNTKWIELGLQSCPAVVFYKNDIPIGNIVSYSNFAAIATRLKNYIATPPNCDINNKVDWQSIPDKLQHKIPFAIVGSSGSHRYLRWNEENVKNMDKYSGWCSPSDSNGNEYIILEIPQNACIERVFIGGRHRLDGTPSEKSFPLEIVIQSADTPQGPWIDKFTFDNTSRTITSADIRLNDFIKNKFVKMLIGKKIDIDGKSFPCIANITLFGSMSHSQHKLPMLSRHNIRPTETSIIRKYGLFFDKSGAIEQIDLPPHKKYPAFWSNVSRFILNIEGTVFIKIDNQEEFSLNSSDGVAINPGSCVEIFTTDSKARIVLTHFGDNIQQIWEAR